LIFHGLHVGRGFGAIVGQLVRDLPEPESWGAGTLPTIAEFYRQLISAVICVLPVSFPMVSVTVTGLLIQL
jgi:hypothetical protein